MKTLTSKITSHADVVGVVPHVLGYMPEESLVLVTLLDDGDQQVLGPCIRLDFGYARATRLSRPDRERICDLLVEAGPVVKIIPVLFSDEIARAHGTGGQPVSPTLYAQFSESVMRVCDDLVAEGYGVFQPLWAGGASIGQVGHHGVVDTLDAAQATPAATEMVVAGSATAADFAQAVALPPANASLRDDAARLDGQELGALVEPVLASIVALHDLAIAADTCGRDVAGCVTAQAVAGITAMIREKWSRDLLLMMLGFDHPDFPIENLRDVVADEFLARARQVAHSSVAGLEVIGLSARRPDMHMTDYSLAYLKFMAVHCGPGAVAGVLAMVSWFEWARGMNSFARHYADAALELEPDNLLAALAGMSAAEGLTPGWMRR